MNAKKPIHAMTFLIIGLITMLGIFALIAWRGGAVLDINLDTSTIILISIVMAGITITSIMLSNLAGKRFEVVGIFLLGTIYSILIVTPLLALDDIIGIWYKIAPIYILVIILVWLGYGTYKGTKIKITPLHISSKQISKNHSIVFISDIHVDAIRDHRYIQSIVNHIKKITPDLVLIGGDLVNSAKFSHVDAFLPFNQLTMPIYATLGNHDHMGDEKALFQIFEKTKIIAIRNQSIDIHEIQIIGIDDKSYRGDKKLHEILDENIIVAEDKFSILVSHQPQHLRKLENYAIDLELAGHTHNGQFIPLSWIIRTFNDYAYGKYHHKEKTAFVSQGIGSRGAPIRIGTQSELVLISLEPGIKK